MRRIASFVLGITLCTAAAAAADTVLFNPATFDRDTGQPRNVTRQFRVNYPRGESTLRITNRGVTSATVTLNGRVILGPDDFGGRDRDDVLRRKVVLRHGANQLDVEVRSKPGTSLTVDIVGEVDDTPPTIHAAVSPAPNAGGWNNANVVVTFTCSDSESGVASCPAPVTVATEGAGQVVSGTARDNAGNAATTSVTLNIDKTAPAVLASAAPSPNANGWNNSPVVVTFTATDGLSGVAPGSISPPKTLSSDGAGQSAAGHATDRAGNAGAATLSGINIDRTPPTISVSLSPHPNAAGWNTGPVTAHFTCGDALSGVSVCPLDQIISMNGTNLTVSGMATDRAGNTASVTSAPFNIFQTGPIAQAIAVGGAALRAAQKADGGWNAAVGGPDCDCANIIGVDALGLLAAERATGDAALLTAAIASGDRLVAIFNAQPTAVPKAQHIEFLAGLGGRTGNPVYESIAAAWFQATIAQYPNAADRVGALLALRDSQGFRTLAAWDAAALIRAAKAIGQVGYATDAAKAIVGAEPIWKDTDPTHRFDRCSNPAGCGWAGDLVSFDWTMLAEGSLLWAIHDLPGFDQKIAEYRAFLLAQQAVVDAPQDPAGSWDAGDLQVTAYAILGLAASGSEGTDPSARAATMFYLTSQLTSGGWPSFLRAGEHGDDEFEIDSEALQALTAVLAAVEEP